jgi:hypothetical protein
MSAESPNHLSLTLASFPPELHLKIFSELESITSICLGLTRKKFYHIHKELHPSFFNYHIPLSWYFGFAPGIDIFLKEWYVKAGYKFRITYDSKVGGPWAEPAGEFMTDEEWKLFRQLKDFLEHGFMKAKSMYGVGDRERWFMVHRGVPSHKVWTDWPTRPLNPSSQAKDRGRVMWDPGRVTVKELHRELTLKSRPWKMHDAEIRPGWVVQEEKVYST